MNKYKYELTISMKDNADGGDHYYLVQCYATLEEAKADFEAIKASHKLENLDRDSAYYSECMLDIYNDDGEHLAEYDEYINKIYKVKTRNNEWGIYGIALYDEKVIEKFEAEQDEDDYFDEYDYEGIFDFKYNHKKDEGMRTYYVIK